jgi:hypothetical protein
VASLLGVVPQVSAASGSTLWTVGKGAFDRDAAITEIAAAPDPTGKSVLDQRRRPGDGGVERVARRMLKMATR